MTPSTWAFIDAPHYVRRNITRTTGTEEKDWSQYTPKITDELEAITWERFENEWVDVLCDNF